MSTEGRQKGPWVGGASARVGGASANRRSRGTVGEIWRGAGAESLGVAHPGVGVLLLLGALLDLGACPPAPYLFFSSCVVCLVNRPQRSPMRKSRATPAPITVRM